MILPISFPKETSNQQNIGILANRINELVQFLNEKYPDPEPVAAEPENVFDKKLRPGVRITKNGRYYIPGKGFMKKEESYL